MLAEGVEGRGWIFVVEGDSMCVERRGRMRTREREGGFWVGC